MNNDDRRAKLQQEISRLSGKLTVLIKSEKVIDHDGFEHLFSLFDELAIETKEEEYVSKEFIGRMIFLYGIMYTQASYSSDPPSIIDICNRFLWNVKKICHYPSEKQRIPPKG
ncbi:hypothetical protein [Brevibacillus dissolubilis]|uniref:hypothetical protein n=1 Tax=Brevibacillus dissolubilis TaxID=1844116 RepID=UPI0011176D76|nr:hypothetical protein [Brevibacillus dissolubilis]